MLTIRYPSNGVYVYNLVWMSSQWGSAQRNTQWVSPISGYTDATFGGYLSGYRNRSHPNPCSHIELYGSLLSFDGYGEDDPSSYPMLNKPYWRVDPTSYVAACDKTMYVKHKRNSMGKPVSIGCWTDIGDVFEYYLLKIRHDNSHDAVSYTCRVWLEVGSKDLDGTLHDVVLHYEQRFMKCNVGETSGPWQEVIQTKKFGTVRPSYKVLGSPTTVRHSQKRWTTSDWYGRFLISKITNPFHPIPENDLVMDCIKNLKSLDINTVTAVQGLVNCWKDIKGLIDAAEGHVSVKWLTGLYLQMKYGFANTVRDAMDILKYMRKELSQMMGKYSNRQISHSADTIWYTPVPGIFSFEIGRCTTTLTTCTNVMDNALAELVHSTMDIDVFPELGNIWDIIPFSFVVDWFIPFGDLFDAVDANTYRSTLAVQYCTVSYDYRFTGVDITEWVPSITKTRGNVDVRCYLRRVMFEIPSPSLSLHVPTGFTQWIPAGAMILQAALNRRSKH